MLILCENLCKTYFLSHFCKKFSFEISYRSAIINIEKLFTTKNLLNCISNNILPVIYFFRKTCEIVNKVYEYKFLGGM